MFSSLKIKEFRIYWFGMVVSLVGTWMQQMAQSWLVFELTNSGFFLGVVGFFSSIPIFLFSLFGGAIADKYPKRNLLIITQVLFMASSLILGLLTSLKMVTVTQIIIIALANGLIMAFDAPTRQSIVMELVGKNNIANAIALNSAAFNSARIIGPALAGIFVSLIGIEGCFYANGISFLAVIFALFLIHPRQTKLNNNNVLADLLAVKNFILTNRNIRNFIYIVSIASLFGTGHLILMPIFADNVFRAGAFGLGVMMSFNGVGALLGAFILAALSNYKYKGKLLVLASIGFSAFLFLFGLSTNFLLSCFLLGLVGFSSVLAVSLINTLLQINVPDELRGRVLSVFMIAFAGFLPFGNLFSGLAAQFLGAQISVLIGASLCFLLFIWLFISNKELKRFS